MRKKIKRIALTYVLIILQVLQVFAVCDNGIVINAKDNRPRILLDSYKIKEGRLVPGGEVTIEFQFKNTSRSIAANNILITYSGTDNLMQPKEGTSNQFYIDEILPDSYKSVAIQMKVSNNMIQNEISGSSEQESGAKEKQAKVEFAISYLYDLKGTHEIVNNLFIMLPITQDCVMDVKSLSIADTALLHSKSLISVVCANGGTAPVHHIVMHVEGNILEEQKKVSIGDVQVNSQQALDCYVNMQAEGRQKLNIYFTYEDEEGIQFKTSKKEYEINVTKNETTSTPTDHTEQHEMQGSYSSGVSLSDLCLIVAAIIMLIGLFVFVRKRKRKREK